MAFWEQRFQREGRVWGDSPSPTVTATIELFQKQYVRTVLVPGSGYGRNAESFAATGFQVSGLDISQTACKLAVASNTEKGLGIDYILGDVRAMPYKDEIFDAVYCFNTLHFFSQTERQRVLRGLYRVVRPGGILVCTVFSEMDPSYGRGREVESNTFESRPGRPAHYFTREDIYQHFTNFQILEQDPLIEWENHGQGPHQHHLRWIVGSKPH